MSAQHTHPGGHASGQQHPISLYLKVWGMLFVLSTMSYLVDYFNIQGFLRWFLIVAFMLLKAGLIIGVFMHMRWERLALMVAILLPPLCLMVLIGMMQAEARYTYDTRGQFFSSAPGGDSTKAEGERH